MRAPQSHFGAHSNNAKINSMPLPPESLLAQFENDRPLLKPGSLSQRLELLDELD